MATSSQLVSHNTCVRQPRPGVVATGAAAHEGGVGPAACARSVAEAARSTCGAPATPAPRRPPLPF